MHQCKTFWTILFLVAGQAAQADDVKKWFQEKFQLDEIFEAAAYAAERCPGLHLIEDNVMATANAAGVTDDEIYTQEWKF
jgi:hypothetical protein